MLEITKILSRFPLSLSGTGPDGRITKKDVESFVPSKAAPVSRLEMGVDFNLWEWILQAWKALWKGSSAWNWHCWILWVVVTARLGNLTCQKHW